MGDCLQGAPRKERTSCEAGVKSCSCSDSCRAWEWNHCVTELRWSEVVWSAAVHTCSSVPVSKSSCWPRHSSSISLMVSQSRVSFASIWPLLLRQSLSWLLCITVLLFYFVLFEPGQDGSASSPLHFQFIFHYLKTTFASWVWATAELCPPSSYHVHCPAAGCGWGQPFVLLGTQ